MKNRYKPTGAQLSFFTLSFICRVLSVFFLCTFLALLAQWVWGKCQLCHLAALLLHAAALTLVELCDLCQLCTVSKTKLGNE